MTPLPDTSSADSASTNSTADKRYRLLFALSPQPAWVYDRVSLRFLEVNEAAVRSYGWSREEFLALTIRDIHPPSQQSYFDAVLADMATNDRHSGLSVHRTKAGKILRVEINAYSFEFDGHQARMVLVNDVTDREAAAEALVRSEEKYRSVIEQLQDVFFRIDADGKWSFLNQAWTKLTGNPVESSLGTPYLGYVHPS